MTFLLILSAITALAVVYVLWLRNWLKQQPWAQGFYILVDPIERVLFKKSETILWARLKMFVGVLLTVLTQIGALDLTPLMPFVPDQYEGLVRLAFNLLPLTITVVGVVDEKLRNETTKPIELVAIAAKDMTPAVAEAVAVADAAKVEAVAVVKEAAVDKAAAGVVETAKATKEGE